MRRGAALLIFGGLSLALVPIGSRATAFAETTGPRVPSESVAISFAPGQHRVVIGPGDTGERSVSITNHSSELRLDVRVTAENAEGSKDLSTKDTEDDRPAGWTTVVDSVTTLDPGASAEVPLRVRVPHDALPGDRTVRLVARANGARRVSDGVPIEGLAVAFVELTVDVDGSNGAQVSILDARGAEHDGNHVLEVRLRNIGDAHAKVAGTVDVGTPPSQHLTFDADVGARTDDVVQVPWKPPPKGSHDVVTVNVTYGHDDTATWSSPFDRTPVTQEKSQSTAAKAAAPSRSESGAGEPGGGIGRFLLPALVVAVALGTGGWLVAEVRRGRRRRAAAPRVRRAYVPMAADWSDEGVASLAHRIDELEQTVDELVGRAGASREPAATRPIFEPAGAPIDSSRGYPFDWPTEEDLAEFNARRARA
jgi:hypothetical protein